MQYILKEYNPPPLKIGLLVPRVARHTMIISWSIRHQFVTKSWVFLSGGLCPLTSKRDRHDWRILLWPYKAIFSQNEKLRPLQSYFLPHFPKKCNVLMSDDHTMSCQRSIITFHELRQCNTGIFSTWCVLGIGSHFYRPRSLAEDNALGSICPSVRPSELSRLNSIEEQPQ